MALLHWRLQRCEGSVLEVPTCEPLAAWIHEFSMLLTGYIKYHCEGFHIS
jgi:hypothetical protein